MFAVSEINKIGIGFISIFLLKARVSYLTISKRKNLSLPLKDETDQFVTCLVLPECLSVKISPSNSEANRDGADTESSFPLFFSFSGSFKNSRTREKKISGEEENICRRRKYLAKRFAHAIRVHYRDFELAYVC